MIKVNEISSSKLGENGKIDVAVGLIADTSSEVIAIGDDATTVVGLGADYKIGFGSICLSADGKFGIITSTGEWKFN